MAKKKPVDPVTAYARAVIAGQIVAGRLVRLACARHLRDLETASARGLVWKPDEAQRIIDFFAEVLCLPENTDAADEWDDEDVPNVGDEGRPFILSPFQQFIVGSLFGWHTVRGHRRFHVAYLEQGKGSGKTPMCAGVLLYMLVADGERGAQLFCAAVTKDQAKLAYTDAERMVQASPALRELIDQKVNNLAVLETGSFLRPISSEKRGLDGKRVHGAVLDEEHEHPDGTVYLKMRAGIKGRNNALILIPTNSGFDLESICWKHHDYSRQVLEGIVENDAWFAYVCHLDACETCQAAGKIQPSDDCPACDDWKTEGPHWLKANPNLGVSLPWQYLRDQVREAIDIPSQRNMVRRLNFCQWTQQATVWIPLEQWAACGRQLTLADLRGRPAYLGIDLSDKIDLSSVVVVCPRSVRGRDDGLTVAVDVIPYFWLPKKTLQRRAQEDKIDYPAWEKAGSLRVTEGATVDHDVIVDTIIDEIASVVSIQGIGVDQAGASAVVTRLSRHFGDEMVLEVPQGFRALSEPSKALESHVVGGTLVHDGNPLMAWCVSNTAIEENHWKEIRPVKIHQRKRIDGAVALVDGLYMVGKADPSEGASKYEQEGLAVV